VIAHLMPVLLALADDAKPAVPAGRSLLSYVADGGFLSYVLIGLSAVAVTLIVRMAMVLRRDLFMPEAILRELTSAAQEGNLSAFAASCGRSDSFAARVLYGGVRRAQTSPMGMLEFNNGVEDEMNRETERLHRMNDVVAIVAAVAPMLGLLGTVIGMIGAFATISALQGAARSNELARFMSMALVNTAEGLVIAIPATIAFGLARRRIESLVDETAETIEPIAALVQRAASGAKSAAPRPVAPAPAPRPQA
jgi:biopolymer transport protein ExbB